MRCPHLAPASLLLTSLSSEQTVLASPHSGMSLVLRRGRGRWKKHSQLLVQDPSSGTVAAGDLYSPVIPVFSAPDPPLTFNSKDSWGFYRKSQIVGAGRMLEDTSCLTPWVSLFWHLPDWILKA